MLRATAIALAAAGFSFSANSTWAQGPIQIREPAVKVRPAEPAVRIAPAPLSAGAATGLPVPVPANGPALLPPQTAAPVTQPPELTAELNDIVANGSKLESQRRWGEALALYEDEVRKNPAITQLSERIDLAKIHYDLGRRYADGSFRRTIGQLDEAHALDLYNEVLAKILTHYVQQPDWRHILTRGTLDLEVALNEPSFANSNQLQAAPDTINDFRRRLHNLTDNRLVRDKDELRTVVASAAHLARAELGINPTAVILEYTAGAAGGLDEYSTFLTADQLNDLYSQIDGNFVGLGVELKAADSALLIVNVIHGSPAERAGIKAGDRLTAVAGRFTRDLTTDQAAELLQGEEGTSVELQAVTAGEPPRRIVVRREHVDVPSVDDVKMIDPDNGIAYFKLTCFQKTTSRDMDAALWKLYRQGMKSLVIDLRGNPGGLLTAAVDVGDKFIDQGRIVSTEGRSPQENYVYSARGSGAWRVPLVVLIDGDSASASEIFAGAIRDHHRGVIVGVRSYGKGSVQGIFPLNIAGTGIRLTTAKFYSPNHLGFVHVGVTPDVVVHETAKPITGPGQLAIASSGGKSDAILAAGLQAARNQVVR
ncbi:MAG TPA: S41 family peptidase, partial [Pirellulales bacterium]|nr:S41 family peptidase [Pirellulales bacterium]